MSLIGSERSISLEYPSEFTRDWFLERFRLVQEDVMTIEEKSEKIRVLATKERSIRHFDIESARKLVGQLRNGIKITIHHPTGKIYDALFTYDGARDSFVVTPVAKTAFGFGAPKLVSLSVQDVADIRPGIHSIGFVRTGSANQEAECFSIIGTECTIDLQINERGRNLFIEKLRILVNHIQANFTSGTYSGSL